MRFSREMLIWILEPHASHAIASQYAPTRWALLTDRLPSPGLPGRCGSAALGGIFATKYGYSSTFLITAAIQFTGTLVQLTLWPMVPRAEKPPGAASALPILAGSIQGGGAGAAPAAPPVSR